MAARDLTKTELLHEEIRCHKGMLYTWEQRMPGPLMDRLLAEQYTIIAAAEARIVELQEWLVEAPKKVEEYTRRRDEARNRLLVDNNQPKVDALKKLTSKVAAMQAELESMRTTNPEEYNAIMAMLQS